MSTNPAHMGEYSIPPFQTWSRYFYAGLGEACCGQDFLFLFFQQFHPFPHCDECASVVIQSAFVVCWRCRTYFCRYGTGQMKQIIGITMQRHDHQSVHNPARGELQPREPREMVTQTWRDTQLLRLPQPILQILLPRAPECQFWSKKLDFFNSFGNRPVLRSVNYISMPFHSEEAFHPLPRTPQEGFRAGLSLQPSVLDEAGVLDSSSDEEQTHPPLIRAQTRALFPTGFSPQPNLVFSTTANLIFLYFSYFVSSRFCFMVFCLVCVGCNK